jgi:hypothetical protein
MELTADVANFHAQSLLDPPDFAPLHTPTLTCAAADHHRIPAPPQSAAGGRPAGHTGRMRRVLVVGMSGAGKTTAARRVGAKLGLPFHEMDALALGPNLTGRKRRIWSTRSEGSRPSRPGSSTRGDTRPSEFERWYSLL